MKRVGVFTSVAVLCLSLLGGSALAQTGTSPDWADKSGGVGVGGQTTLGGTNGLNIRYFVSNAFGVGLVFGFDITKVTVGTGDAEVTNSVNTYDFGIYGSYKLAFWQRGSLSAILGFDIEAFSTSAEAGGTTTDASATNFVLGIGLMGEWFPTQYLSLFIQMGLTLDLIGEDERSGSAVDTVADRSGFELGLRSGLLGSAGFTVWFK